MFWNKYPYTDMHELNLDWILAEIMKLHHDYDEFKAINEIHNAGAWDITKQYQAWTIVSDNNVGYISLKPVPAGVSINNTEYWGMIADYDVMISDLESRITDLESDVSDIQAALDADNELIVVGDSWLDPDEGGAEVMPLLRKLLNIKTAKVHNYAIGGTGFCKNYLTNIVDQLAGSASDASVNPDKVKYIIALGGTNDYGVGITGAEYIQAFADMQAFVESTYKNAKLYIFFMQAARNRTYPNDLINWVKAHSAANVINIGWPINLNEFADDLHPTASGYAEVARFIAANVLGYIYKVKTYKVTFTDEYNTEFPSSEYVANDINIVVDWDESSIRVFLYLNYNRNSAGSKPFGSVTIPSLGIPILPFASGNPIVWKAFAPGIATEMNFQIDTNTNIVINMMNWNASAAGMAVFGGAEAFIWANANHS